MSDWEMFLWLNYFGGLSLLLLSLLCYRWIQ